MKITNETKMVSLHDIGIGVFFALMTVLVLMGIGSRIVDAGNKNRDALIELGNVLKEYKVRCDK